jgi:hypothetical protein
VGHRCHRRNDPVGFWQAIEADEYTREEIEEWLLVATARHMNVWARFHKAQDSRLLTVTTSGRFLEGSRVQRAPRIAVAELAHAAGIVTVTAASCCVSHFVQQGPRHRRTWYYTQTDLEEYAVLN